MNTNSHDTTPHHTSWMAASIVAIVMVMLALLGVGLTTADAANARTYWMLLVPVYAALCIGTAWYRGRNSGISTRPMIVRQLLHWFCMNTTENSPQPSGAGSGTASWQLVLKGIAIWGLFPGGSLSHS